MLNLYVHNEVIKKKNNYYISLSRTPELIDNKLVFRKVHFTDKKKVVQYIKNATFFVDTIAFTLDLYVDRLRALSNIIEIKNNTWIRREFDSHLINALDELSQIRKTVESKDFEFYLDKLRGSYLAISKMLVILNKYLPIESEIIFTSLQLQIEHVNYVLDNPYSILDPKFSRN
ncbi:hypothetical protein KRE43_05470 [Elizabethkingia meningoseptica]|uniref:hypothetical protein n=1 Tax=Elizabethkingia meningoseptica TaxID=238 RepID=UPI000841DE62|nr:hypothetical protein [Elizabethkingia meningoseptica]MDE5481387.1 hypothetical protein [Elizabethkingia meningoseptica]MDE5487320.1 hypothetical protein [Elizabethkingia meningoseptica]MDE5515136.1 hypothetical protein [Elizabethkingia meningoseptica]MDE5525873.1 hypothetical protein [Elizabethkingia meningoseptica]MDE5529402.1 hypothetical protein [Elizabethkingia meningoseptica]